MPKIIQRAGIACAVAMAALSAASINPPALAGDCSKPEAQIAETLFSNWSAALKTQHPDRVTRLFADDGVLVGFASPVGREGYMPIRDYFLYFLQYEPRARIVDRKVDTGCDFLVDQGTLIWTLKPRSGGAAETREARYRIMYEKAEGGWRIAEFGDALSGPKTTVAYFAVPPPGSGAGRAVVVDPATGAAVAGFVKRAEPVTAPLAKVGGPAQDAFVKPVQREPTPADDVAPSKSRPKAQRKPAPAQVEIFSLDSFPREIQ